MHYKKWHLAGLFFPCLPLYPRKLLLRTEILETFFDLHLRLKFSHCIILQRSPIFCLGAFLNFVFLLHYNVYWKIRWIGHAVFMVAFSMILHLTMVIPINTRTHTHTMYRNAGQHIIQSKFVSIISICSEQQTNGEGLLRALPYSHISTVPIWIFITFQ